MGTRPFKCPTKILPQITETRKLIKFVDGNRERKRGTEREREKFAEKVYRNKGGKGSEKRVENRRKKCRRRTEEETRKRT